MGIRSQLIAYMHPGPYGCTGCHMHSTMHARMRSLAVESLLCCVCALVTLGSGLHCAFPAEQGGPVTGRVRSLEPGIVRLHTYTQRQVKLAGWMRPHPPSCGLELHGQGRRQPGSRDFVRRLPRLSHHSVRSLLWTVPPRAREISPPRDCPVRCPLSSSGFWLFAIGCSPQCCFVWRGRQVDAGRVVRIWTCGIVLRPHALPARPL